MNTNPTTRGHRCSLAFLWENYGPYHIDRITALYEAFSADFDILGVELNVTSDTYAWERAAPSAIPFRKTTIFPCGTPRSIFRQVLEIFRTLPKGKNSYVFLCSYQSPAIFLVAVLLRVFGGRVFVMNNSKFDDYERFLWRELGKRIFMFPYHGALSCGKRSRDYMRLLGVPRNSIAGQYNTVSIERIRRDAGVDPAPSGPAFGDRHFTCIARLIPKKNLGVLLDAYALYCGSVPKPRALHLCGSGPELERLKDQARALGIDDLVIFRGWQQADAVAVTLGQSLVLLLPSIEEQFGNVVIEAQALGVPVILSDNCGARDQLVRTGVNGFVVEPDNSEGLAYFMAEISEKEDLWRKLALAATRSAPLGDVQRFVEGVEALIGISRNGLPVVSAGRLSS